MRGLLLIITASFLLAGYSRESVDIDAASNEHTSTAVTQDDGDGKADIVRPIHPQGALVLLHVWRSRGDGSFDACHVTAHNALH